MTYAVPFNMLLLRSRSDRSDSNIPTGPVRLLLFSLKFVIDLTLYRLDGILPEISLYDKSTMRSIFK